MAIWFEGACFLGLVGFDAREVWLGEMGDLEDLEEALLDARFVNAVRRLLDELVWTDTPSSMSSFPSKMLSASLPSSVSSCCASV